MNPVILDKFYVLLFCNYVQIIKADILTVMAVDDIYVLGN
jgi:hypothetical protein